MRRARGFTLLEALVVVAIIAILAAVLMPSLSRTRAQARMVACQSNLRTLATAFLTYAGENKGRLPGHRNDYGADWLGRSNPGGKQPENGTLYKKYMSSSKQAYRCPEDKVKRPGGSGAEWYSYTGTLLLSGAKPDMLAGAHYPLASSTVPTNPQYNRSDHRIKMQAFDGVPMVIEEDPYFSLVSSADGAWSDRDSLATTHLSNGSLPGYGNIAFLDSHAGRLKWPKWKSGMFSDSGRGIQARDICLRTVGGKWVSGRSAISGGMYGFMDNAPAAEAPNKPFRTDKLSEAGGGGLLHNVK